MKYLLFTFTFTFTLLFATNIFASDFEETLAFFDDLPQTLSNQQIQDIANEKPSISAYFHENNYARYSYNLKPIGKIKTHNGYFLLTGTQTYYKPAKQTVVYLHGYLVDKKGKLQDKEHHIFSSGLVGSTEYIASYRKKGREHHFYTEEIDMFSQKHTHRYKIYRISKNEIDYQKTIRQPQNHVQ